ncbi:MAG: universal stress protein [Nitrosopumilus sp.]|nr:universal stress protein [Nitrosopumilus sp.]
MSNEFNFESILVPYNATPGAERGLQAAIELAKKLNGQITLLTCIESQSILAFFIKQEKKQEFEHEKKLIESELKKIESKIKELKKPIKHVVLKSSFAPSTIVEYVEKNNIDTVVIGQTKMIGTEGKYHESMANYLLNDLVCPLLVVK